MAPQKVQRSRKKRIKRLPCNKAPEISSESTYLKTKTKSPPAEVLNTNLHTFLLLHIPPKFNKKFLESLASKLNLSNISGKTTHEVAGRLIHALKQIGTRPPRLSTYNSKQLPEMLDLFSISKNILVITGAGISTSLGIPDFRSFKGLYSQLNRIGLNESHRVFHIDTFMQNPSLFYLLAHMIVPNGKEVSEFH